MNDFLPQRDDTAKTASQAAASEQLRFTDEQFIWRFSPNQTDPELLEAIFVGREDLLQNVLEKVAAAASSGSTHNVLLYGPRGIGKSHFVSLLHHRVSQDEKLSDAVHMAWLNEDETTTSMVQLLVRIYRSLCKAYPGEYSAAWLNELLNQPPDEIAQVLTRRLAVRFENRRLLILVENLNLLFDNLGTQGQHQLRTFLQERHYVSVIATSQQMFKAVTDRNEPFFGFFQPIQLKPLTLQDAQQLLVKIANSKGQADLAAFLNTPDGRGRVRAIHDLAGGNHRVYIVLSGFVTRESLDQLVAPFQKMADDLTPYYQERLRWFSAQQRQIVELLCREHGTLNPKEIARRLLVDQRTIGKQVRILVEIGYLTSTKRGRETFYELSEPLMRLAYEVKEHSLLEMLIEFLRIWYRPDQMQQLCSSGLSEATQAYMDAAWERSQTHPDPRLKILQDEIDQAEADGRRDELAALWEEKAAASGEASDWFLAGYYFDVINKEHATAINCYDEVLKLDCEDADALNNKGVSLDDLGRHEEALRCYDRAIEFAPEYANAWNNKGCSLCNHGRFDEALGCFDHTVKLAPKYSDAWTNRGSSLHDLGRDREALSSFDKAIELDIESARAWNGRGTSLHGLGRYREAMTCYDKAVELDTAFGHPRFNRSEAFFAMHRWDDGFGAIRDSFTHAERPLSFLGDVASMFSLILRLSEDDVRLQSHISTLVDLYEQASRDQISGPAGDPLAYLGDGLVKSLAKIDAERVTPKVLESYVAAVEQRVAGLPEFEIPLRLFRYGIRYLISGNESEFVELIQPERRILRQALGLDAEK